MKELALTNGRFCTSDEQNPWADTVVVRDGRFAFVGRAGDRPGDPSIATVDLGGSLVLPGLIDSHTHPSAVAASGWHVPLPWTDDVDEILAFVRAYGEAHPPSEMPFLYFEYYPSTLFGDGRPTKELLDSANSDRPALCQEFSEHSSWVNSRMLELMGVTNGTPDPVPDLEMFARTEDGEPTGHVYEKAWAHFADRMYDALGWRPPEAVTVENLRPVLRFLTDSGVTTLFEALLPDEDTLRALTALEAAGELDLYYEGAPRFRTSADLPDVLATVHRYQTEYGSERIRIGTVKLFLDGTNESGNSAVLEPFIEPVGGDRCGADHGQLQMDADELTDSLLLANDADVDVHIHLVGDRAFRVGCDAVQAARDRAGEDWRTQVTFAHCELVDPADMARPAELGIAVNWTTHWSGGYFGEESRTFLGGQRWNRMYAFNEIAANGVLLTFSSDVVTSYELNRGNPFFGMQVAHTRVDPQYPLDPSRYANSMRPTASSRLPLDRLVRGYTIDGARQLRLDDG